MNKKILLLCLFLYSYSICQPPINPRSLTMQQPIMNQPRITLRPRNINISSPIINQPEMPPKQANVVDEQEALSNKKMKAAKTLTDNAIKHILNVSIEDACYDFTYNPVWRKDGDLFVAVYDKDGICLAHGDDVYLIWKNIKSTRTFGSTPILPQMLMAGPKGKKLSYIWDNAYRSAYVRAVEKDGVPYIVEVGFYPKDNRYLTKETVNSVKTYLNQYTKSITFSLVNDPAGPFAKNDISTMILDMDGNCLANNQNSGLINQNILDLTDANDVPIVREFLKIADGKGYGWFSYIWQNAPTEAYIEKVLDPKSARKQTEERYLVIVSNYYPNQGIDVVQNFVTRAASFLKSNGPDVAFKEFTDKVGNFVKGGLSIYAFDLHGNCLANWDDPGLVGQNLINRTDQQGKPIVREIIRLAKRQGRGIISYYMRNSTTMDYIQLVHTPNGPFILGCTFYPQSKAEYIKTLVEHAARFLTENEMTTAFNVFSSRNSQFHLGDAHVFVYSTNGRRLVNGPFKDGIWRNFTKTTDQQGVPVVQEIITTALNGGGWVTYKIRNGTRRVFTKAVVKQDEAGNPQTFIIGSGYFV